MDSTVLLVFAAQILVTSGKCWEAPESAIALKKKGPKMTLLSLLKGSGGLNQAPLTTPNSR